MLGRKAEERRAKKISKAGVFFLLLSSLFTLSSCGFQPQYGVNRDSPYGVEEYLALVQIEGIPDREGQYLRNALIDRFYRHARPQKVAYILKVEEIREALVDLDITKDSDATRGQLRLNTRMTLLKATTREVLLDRNLRAITSYNILGSEFANRVTEENARQNALDDLARQIEMQISLYLKRKDQVQ